MMWTATCDGKRDKALTEHNRKIRKLLHQQLWAALEAGPATTRELSARMGEHPWQPADRHVVRGCHGHLSDRVYVTHFSCTDIGNVLRRLERQGLVTRVVMQGWQSQLWAAR